jgi:hypothetical protein
MGSTCDILVSKSLLAATSILSISPLSFFTAALPRIDLEQQSAPLHPAALGIKSAQQNPAYSGSYPEFAGTFRLPDGFNVTGKVFASIVMAVTSAAGQLLFSWQCLNLHSGLLGRSQSGLKK